MPLRVLPAVEADALRIAEVERDAYLPSPVNPVLFPGPFPENSLEIRAGQLVDSLRTEPWIRWFKVVDTDISAGGAAQLIAFAQWNVYHPDPAPKPAERSFGPGVDVAACEEFFAGLARMRDRFVGGRSHVYLRYLEVDPKHQRRGAGRMLMQWGIDEAERLRVPVWLEASPEGKRLYESCGLEVVDVFDLDLTKYGASGVHSSYGMRRDPKPS